MELWVVEEDTILGNLVIQRVSQGAGLRLGKNLRTSTIPVLKGTVLHIRVMCKIKYGEV
jgi:hypothetical protein